MFKKFQIWLVLIVLILIIICITDINEKLNFFSTFSEQKEYFKNLTYFQPVNNSLEKPAESFYDKIWYIAENSALVGFVPKYTEEIKFDDFQSAENACLEIKSCFGITEEKQDRFYLEFRLNSLYYYSRKYYKGDRRASL